MNLSKKRRWNHAAYVFRIERNFWTLPFDLISYFEQIIQLKSYFRLFVPTKIVKVYQKSKKI
jgi:hypothetical protein